MRRRARIVLASLVAAATPALAVSAAEAALGENVRGGGVLLALPDGWSRVLPVRDDRDADPRTLLVIGTDGVRLTDSDCQVSSYRIPADGAAVVVIGWRDGTGGTGSFSGLRLRRGTFECFAGRGAWARVTRRDRDFQINVMVGDRADAATIADAFEAARSLALPPRG